MNDEAPSVEQAAAFGPQYAAGSAPASARAPGRGPVFRWRMLSAANLTVLREAKSLLFAELAESLRQGMPLPTALELASHTIDGYRRSLSSAGARGRMLRRIFYGVPLLLFGFAALMYLPGLMAAFSFFLFLYWISATRLADPERVSRVLAYVLLESVQKGLSLAEAMRRNGQFDETEARIAELGHQYGRLPEALQRLGAFQMINRRLHVIGNMMMYPCVVAMVLLALLSFCILKIMPKFKDIYDQLGAELPPLTTKIQQLASFVSTGYFAVGAIVILTIAAIAMMRGIFNGTLYSKILLGLFVSSLIACLVGVAISGLLSEPQSQQDPTVLWAVIFGVGVAAVFSLFSIPYILGFLESVIQEGDREAGVLLIHVPLIGAARQAELEARWLSALSLAVTSGASSADAVRAAGRVCGGAMRDRSEAASALCSGGLPIGSACLKARVLSRKSNHRMALIDHSADYPGGLRQIADDTSERALETMERVNRICAIGSLIAMGVVSGVFAIAMYAPLFGIVRVVGFETHERPPSPQRVIDPILPQPYAESYELNREENG